MSINVQTYPSTLMQHLQEIILQIVPCVMYSPPMFYQVSLLFDKCVTVHIYGSFQQHN